MFEVGNATVWGVGDIVVSPSVTLHRWWQFRKKKQPPSDAVLFQYWHFEMPDGFPLPDEDNAIFHWISKNWYQLSDLAMEWGNYRDYREGTDKYGTRPDCLRLTRYYNRFDHAIERVGGTEGANE